MKVVLAAASRGEISPPCHACVPSTTRDELALGIYLGHNYGVAVNYLDNGTAVTLAKVSAQPEYSELIERLIKTRPTGEDRRDQGRFSPLLRTVQRTLGFATTNETAILGRMVSDLRKASEKALGRGIRGQRVSVTAPWQPVWRDEDKNDCDINDALYTGGLKPWDPASPAPLYLSEVRASLGASGRILCGKSYGCEGFTRDPEDVSQYIFYISFTNQSLYTTFIQGGCFYNSPQILGRDEERLLTRGAYFKRWIKSRNFYTIKPTILVTGEAANHPELVPILEKIASRLPVILPQGEDAGAALWSRMKLEEGSYCKTAQCCERAEKPKEGGDKEREEL
ncbi:unnamed protein product [Parascedosporium putredinis]|uniref:Uncharacterized protein n=1 Tax=Parascedosporium putredinis TaxID=1442378 RepID=A0A9P1H8X3_9PEZI|nr:unnamed protein product [Parascedosporium putredinis]CAI8002507.1 unnamed protein product [Parascedosporium putredinis]